MPHNHERIGYIYYKVNTKVFCICFFFSRLWRLMIKEDQNEKKKETLWPVFMDEVRLC